MATRQYNIAVDESSFEVAEIVGGAITSGVVEVTIDLAVATGQKEVLIALQKIVEYITKDDFPPA